MGVMGLSLLSSAAGAGIEIKTAASQNISFPSLELDDKGDNKVSRYFSHHSEKMKAVLIVS